MHASPASAVTGGVDRSLPAGPGYDRALEVRAALAQRVRRAGWAVRVEVIALRTGYELLIEGGGPDGGSPDPGSSSFPIGEDAPDTQAQRIYRALQAAGFCRSCEATGPTYRSGSTWCAPV